MLALRRGRLLQRLVGRRDITLEQSRRFGAGFFIQKRQQVVVNFAGRPVDAILSEKALVVERETWTG
jgi:hypothetical protein